MNGDPQPLKGSVESLCIRRETRIAVAIWCATGWIVLAVNMLVPRIDVSVEMLEEHA